MGRMAADRRRRHNIDSPIELAELNTLLSNEELERRAAEMRRRWLSQPGRIVAGQPDEKDLRSARAEIRERRLIPVEAASFNRMGNAIRKQNLELQEEKRLTAFYSIRTSWSRIANAEKYAVVSESTFTRRKQSSNAA